jgi:hypothetical protein
MAGASMNAKSASITANDITDFYQIAGIERLGVL